MFTKWIYFTCSYSELLLYHTCILSYMTLYIAFLHTFPQILYLPSKLFYKNKLVCKAVFNDSGPKDIPHLQFVGVDGHEAQDENSPSFYNDQETYQIGEEVSYENEENYYL